MPAGHGSNQATFKRTSDAHSGAFGERIDVTSYWSGDRKLLQLDDNGPCAPAVQGGHSYTFSAWYKSTKPTRFVAYVRNSKGNWQHWSTSNDFPAAGSYTQATWTPPAIPNGATRVVFGLDINAVGTLITDDYALTAR